MAKFAPFKGRAGSGKIRIEGLDRLQADFKRMKNKSDSVMTRQIHLAADRIARFANRDVPVDTGRLLKSIKVEKYTRAATIRVDAPYASFVERGTAAHTIEAKNSSVLTNGKVFFGKKVEHPGTKAQPFFFKHVDPSMKILMRNIKKFIK